MELNKAIRKQKKSYKRFMLTMCFIFFMLPIILLVTKSYTLYYIAYLSSLEVLIGGSVIMRANRESFSYKIALDNLIIKNGLFKRSCYINTGNIALVHADEREDGIDVIIITSGRVRSKEVKPAGIGLEKKYPLLYKKYCNIKKVHPDKDYCYITIKNGGFKKYILVMDLYKSCVNAKFTENAIENIKEWRAV